MTDKQIIIDGINLHGNRKDLTGLKVGKLTCLKPVKTGKNKHSEWLCECECGNFKIAQTYRLLSGRIQSCGDCYHTINHYIPMIKELEKQLKRKEQECEILLGQLVINDGEDVTVQISQSQFEEYNQLKQTLTEIKEVLQFYNNSTIGTDKGNGIFEFEVCNKSGKCICRYDTNPAKQALQKITDCEANND